MFRLILIYICLVLPFNGSSHEVDYRPFLKEIASRESLFTYDEHNDTLFLFYGVNGQRIELFKNRLSTITPLNVKGQINGVRINFEFHKKITRQPKWFAYNYSEGERTSKFVGKQKKIYLIDLQTSKGDSVLIPIDTPMSLFFFNDSLNGNINSWRMEEFDTPHQFRIWGKHDSIMTLISFRNGYFHTIGTYDFRKENYEKTIYIFDFGKLIFRLNLTGKGIVGSHQFYFNGKAFDFKCLAENHECYCSDSEITDSELFNPHSTYFHLKKTTEGNVFVLSRYSYYTLLKYEL